MSIEALRTLCEVRLAAERQAEQRLARAAALHTRELQQQARLAAELDAARARRDRLRRDRGLPAASASAWQDARRYDDRLDSELRRAAAAREAHARGPLAAAAGAMDQARAEQQRARQRREAVERAIERRQAAHRRDQDRRAETEADDLPRRR
jgi:hypothetical protein